jgi:ribosomal protein S18 acetylase RimI-like enzyme
MTADIEAPLRIRAAVPSDTATLVDFNLAMALETEDKRLDRNVLTAGVEAVFAQPQHGFYLIAETNGQVAGCLMITFEWSDWRNGQWWWLQSVYVHPEHRRGGVFRALYAEVERRARAAPGVIGVRLYVDHDNAKAQGVYASLGMECTNYRLYEILFA